MDGPRNCPTEWGKSYRERHISYDIIYMWTLKKKLYNEPIYKTNRITNVENTLLITKGENKLGDWDWHMYIIIYEIDN